MQTLEQLIEKVKLVDLEADKAKRRLVVDYGKEHNPHQIGDIITDHIGSIKIDKIQYESYLQASSTPGAVYEGIIINKDGSLNKKNNRRTVYQCNLT